MGNPEHMALAREGVASWNAWRAQNLRVQPDLTRIDLQGRDLRGIDLRGVGLFKANLAGTDLRGAILRQSILIKTSFAGADLSGAHVYGASVWNVNLQDAIQKDLIITESDEATITVDNLEMAQFLHLMLTNQKIRDIIDTITSKVVLILGRFSPECMPVLQELKGAARRANLLPVLFDFAGPTNRDFTETVRTLAHLARFIVADLTSPSSVPHELQAIIPHLELPVAPIIRVGERPYAMFRDFGKYSWVHQIIEYVDADDVRQRVFPAIISNVFAHHGDGASA